MRAKPPSVPSALARREAVRNRLAGAVDSRDAQAVLSFTGQWVHRQGMASLPPLMAELAQGETLLWWQQLLHQPSEPVGLAPGPAAQAAPEPPAPAPTLQAHLEPAPSSLASVTAAEMDPDPEGSQTAEIPALASKPGESKPGELQPEEGSPKELQPVADSEAPLPAMAPAPAPAQVPAPTTAKPPVPMAMTPVPMAMAVTPGPRQPAAQVRRGAGTSRPAPAPRNPELARLRAWLPDHDSLGGSSRRSHAA